MTTQEPEAKRKRGRPPTGFDKKAYDREYHRNNRARIKALKEKNK